MPSQRDGFLVEDGHQSMLRTRNKVNAREAAPMNKGILITSNHMVQDDALQLFEPPAPGKEYKKDDMSLYHPDGSEHFEPLFVSSDITFNMGNYSNSKVRQRRPSSPEWWEIEDRKKAEAAAAAASSEHKNASSMTTAGMTKTHPAAAPQWFEPEASSPPRKQTSTKSEVVAVKKVPAFAFDIDGVLVRGAQALEHAKHTIETLQQADIPFIFLTNGGGLTEVKHTEKLAGRLDLTLDPRQFVQSHTPFLDLVERFADKPVLVLGGTGVQIRKVASEYGFSKVIISADYFVEDSSLHPFPEMTKDSLLAHGRPWTEIENIGQPLKETHIAAIMVWSSPRDWCIDLQLTLDLLQSRGGLLDTRSVKNGDESLPNRGFLQDNQPELFFCNPDFTWATQATHPRLAQGGFMAALKGAWDQVTGGGIDLGHTMCGKPTDLTYTYGEKVLDQWNARERANGQGCKEIGTVYMIGDNPASDIQGANAFNHVSPLGLPWKSVLVETGVYKKGTTPAFEPTHTSRNVWEAVQWAAADFRADVQQ